SFLVLRRPVIRSPSFHWPRRLSTSTRSNRLSTFRLPPKVAAARRLRCCDINKNPVPVCQRLLRSTWKRELFVTRRPALANGLFPAQEPALDRTPCASGSPPCSRTFLAVREQNERLRPVGRLS